MPGGGVVFPPKPRNYAYTIPKKMKQEGFKSALSYLLSTGRIMVLEDLAMADGKTNALSKNLKKLGFEKAVMIDGKENVMTSRAARNLPKYRYYSAEGMNVYDLLRYNAVILSKDSLEKIATRCGIDKNTAK
jgi:large subunit ribosomal protein L4